MQAGGSSVADLHAVKSRSVFCLLGHLCLEGIGRRKLPITHQKHIGALPIRILEFVQGDSKWSVDRGTAVERPTEEGK